MRLKLFPRGGGPSLGELLGISPAYASRTAQKNHLRIVHKRMWPFNDIALRANRRNRYNNKQ